METRANNRYTARWQHRMKLRFRVWPKFRETHEAILKKKVMPVNGIRIGGDGAPEVWNMTSAGVCGQIFEMDTRDFDTLSALAAAGARQIGRMRVLAPGTADERMKKECWLEVDVMAYDKSPERRITLWGAGWNAAAPHELYGETVEDALGLAGAPVGNILFIESDGDIDEERLLREIVENDAMVVLNRRPIPGCRGGVSTEAGRRLFRRAMFWCVQGRAPSEDGGILRGYQFPDRIVRWNRAVAKENRAEDGRQRLAAMHETTRERGRATRRQYFIENVAARYAQRAGLEPEAAMERFIADGIIDWLLRSVDNVPPVPGREASSLLNGRVTDAVNALEFYYAARETLEGGAQ